LKSWNTTSELRDLAAPEPIDANTVDEHVAGGRLRFPVQQFENAGLPGPRMADEKDE
jgi:hypothetical protein